MKILKNLKSVSVSVLLLGSLAACDNPGPAETAGRQIDQSVSDAGRHIDNAAVDAGNKISNTADKVAEGLGEQSNKAGVGIEDAEITAKVKAAFFAEPGLKTLQISVDTIKGVVTLTGSVNSQQNSDTARALAGAVSGVREVENRLMIQAAK
ncbi:MAG: BON domain-containing protein [Gallionella sp.]|nr:BON domain-containing protein [Gallionella sp.]